MATGGLSESDRDFTAFVESARPRMHRWAYLVCGDWDRAEDIVQSVLLRLYPRWERVEQAESAHAYVRRAVVNAAIDDQRRLGRLRRLERGGTAFPDAVARGVVADGMDGRVLLALSGLGPRQRAVLVLRYLDDLSLEETAHILGVSPGTVKSQAARGLAALRKDLAGTVTSFGRSSHEK